MLVLSRKPNECLVIDGRIRVKVIRVEGEVVKLGIEAPADVPVHRQEVYDEIQRSNREAVTQRSSGLPRVRLARPHPKEATTEKSPVTINPNKDVIAPKP